MSGQSMYVYTVSVGKGGETEPFDKIALVAMSNLHCAHLAEQYIFGNDEDVRAKYDFDVEILGINRVPGLPKVENLDMYLNDDEDEYEDDLEDPFIVDDESQDDVMVFKHSCSTTIKLRDTGFDWVKCPNCKETIQREEIQLIGGNWVFIPNINNGNNKSRR